jgi:hypothetical protein
MRTERPTLIQVASQERSLSCLCWASGFHDLVPSLCTTTRALSITPVGNTVTLYQCVGMKYFSTHSQVIDHGSEQIYLRHTVTYCSKLSCSPSILGVAFLPGAGRAIGRPSKLSRPSTKSAVLNRRPIPSALRSEMNASSYSRDSNSRKLCMRLSTGPTDTNPPRELRAEPNWIETDITYCRQQMRFIHGRGESALKQVTSPPTTSVDETRVTAMRFP